jgi:hypothetical protein
MDCWRVAVLGDGGVGKTALAVQVRKPFPSPPIVLALPDLQALQFTLNCFVGESHRPPTRFPACALTDRAAPPLRRGMLL